MTRARRLGALADAVGGRVDEEHRSLEIDGLAPLESAGPRELSFLAHPRYRSLAEDTGAAAVLARPGTTLPGHAVITVDDPYASFAALMTLFYPEPPVEPGIHAAAWVDPAADVHPSAGVGPGAVVQARARVGARVDVGANAVIGPDVVIGEGTRVAPGAVVLAGSRIGAECRIGPGAVIGSAGFGYVPGPHGWAPIPQVGVVVLEDRVEVGANTSIDRATLGETRLGEGSKLDNLVQIGHNVVVGRGSAIVAQAGIAGSTRLGEGVQLGGQVGLVGHLRIGDGARIGAGSGVHGDVPPGVTWSGAPAFDHAGWRRAVKAFPRLPALIKTVRRLEKRIASIEKKLDE